MKNITKLILAGASFAAAPFLTLSVSAHCDSYEGPIIPVAQEALRTGDVKPLLKWVGPEHETEIKNAFKRTRGVAKDAPAAKELVELWFLETFVRIHREGEGAPYTGLKAAGTMDSFYKDADVALDQGSVDEVAKHVANGVAEEIHKRFAKAKSLQKSAEESPEAGRKFVAAYVEYMHFLEAVHGILNSGEMGHSHN